MSVGEPRANVSTRFGIGCEDYRKLLDEFGVAVKELLQLHQEQFNAIIAGDPESHRFDLLIHMANEKKQEAKYAYMHHVEAHGCSDFNVFNNCGKRSYY